MNAKKNSEKIEAAQESLKTELTGKETEKTKAAEPEKVIYMGPTIRGVAVQGTVFEGGIPPELEEAGTQARAVMALVIPVKDLPKANRELAIEGSALDVLYKKAEKRIEELKLHK